MGSILSVQKAAPSHTQSEVVPFQQKLNLLEQILPRKSTLRHREKKIIKTTSQQKTHSGLVSNMKEKIHHLHEPSSRPAEPDQSSQSVATDFGLQTRWGRKKDRILRRPGQFSNLPAEWHICVGNTSVIPHLHSGHCSPLPWRHSSLSEVCFYHLFSFFSCLHLTRRASLICATNQG